MNIHLNYIVNEKGNRTAVQLPILEWELLIEDYQKVKEYSKLKYQIRDALSEVIKIENQKKKSITLKQFLNDL